jgi:leucyl-tRNA synthetase
MTVLANEQVIDGRGWRSGALVEQRELTQWFFRISDFAEDLLTSLDELDQWPEKVRLMQKNWIGKSEGLRCAGKSPIRRWPVVPTTSRSTPPVPTRFMARRSWRLPPITPWQKNSPPRIPRSPSSAISAVVPALRSRHSKPPRRPGSTAVNVVHPLDPDWTVPVYIANFVLMDYGTGAIFGCPSGDQRDLDFARKYNLPVTPVVMPADADAASFVITDTAYVGDGVMINSRDLDGMTPDQAFDAVANLLEARTLGDAPQAARKTNFRLRDWGMSRQRYWGAPIPVIHCDDCGAVPVPAKDLPVQLPDDVTLDKPGNPLDHHPTWRMSIAPLAARRHAAKPTRWTPSSTRPGISPGSRRRVMIPRPIPRPPAPGCRWISISAASSTRSCTCSIPGSSPAPCVRPAISISKEPFRGLFTQGMVVHETYRAGGDGKPEWVPPAEVVIEEVDGVRRARHAKTGEPLTIGSIEKMSKSKRNVVDPDDIIDSYGADTARFFMLSDSPPDRDVIWTEAGVEGAHRFVQRIWRLLGEAAPALKATEAATGTDGTALAVSRAAHKTVKAIGEDIEKLAFNKAVARLYELVNTLAAPLSDVASGKADAELKAACKQASNMIVLLIAPMMPHLAEECWKLLGNDGMVATTPWPDYDASLVMDDQVTLPVQINGKKRGELTIDRNADQAAVEQAVLALDFVQNATGGNPPRKLIVVPQRIVNVVV